MKTGVLPEGPTDATYMGYPGIGYPDWLSQRQQHIEKLTGKPWQKALLDVDFNSAEYTLYGIFIDEVLQADNLMVCDRPFNLIAWDRVSFGALKSEVMRGRCLSADQGALCIQSHAHIPVSEYEDRLRAILRLSKMSDCS